MNLHTFRALIGEIEQAHGADGAGFDIQVMLTGGHCLRGPFGFIETERPDILPPGIFIVQGHGKGVETFALPFSSIVAVGGCS